MDLGIKLGEYKISRDPTLSWILENSSTSLIYYNSMALLDSSGTRRHKKYHIIYVLSHSVSYTLLNPDRNDLLTLARVNRLVELRN